MEGVMKGDAMLNFIPIHLRATVEQENFVEWVGYWWIPKGVEIEVLDSAG